MEPIGDELYPNAKYELPLDAPLGWLIIPYPFGVSKTMLLLLEYPAVVVPTSKLPEESNVIACVKVIAFPAVPEGAVLNLNPPLLLSNLDAKFEVA
jgi:hypothetical protein